MNPSTISRQEVINLFKDEYGSDFEKALMEAEMDIDLTNREEVNDYLGYLPNTIVSVTDSHNKKEFAFKEFAEVKISGATAEAFADLAEHTKQHINSTALVSGWSNSRYYGINNRHKIIVIDFDSCTENHFDHSGDLDEDFDFMQCKCTMYIKY